MNKPRRFELPMLILLYLAGWIGGFLAAIQI